MVPHEGSEGSEDDSLCHSVRGEVLPSKGLDLEIVLDHKCAIEALRASKRASEGMPQVNVSLVRAARQRRHARTHPKHADEDESTNFEKVPVAIIADLE